MVKIEEISNQNPWWKYGTEFSKYDFDLSRLDKQLIKAKRRDISLGPGRIVVIRGPRQVGKTTYMKKIINGLIEAGADSRRILYLSVDRFLSRRELRNAVDYFLDRNLDAEVVFIFLDEITAFKDWNLEIKNLSDSGIIGKAAILLTGSGGEALRRVGEQLPGRGLEGNEFYMKPLSFREFVLQTAHEFSARASSPEFSRALQLLLNKMDESFSMMDPLEVISKKVDVLLPYKRELDYLFEKYLMCGGFPFVVNEYIYNAVFQSKSEYFKPDIAETFVRTVLGEISKYGKNENIGRQVIREIIDKYGSRFSFTKLSQDTDVSHITTADYVDFLEKSFILSISYAYDLSKKGMRYKGNKKVYFQDPFTFYALKSSLTGKGINDIVNEVLEDEDLRSVIVEGIVFSHLSMSNEVPYLKETNTFLWFYYDERGKEVDNLFNKNGSYLGVEVKYKNNVGVNDVARVNGIKDFIILSKEDFVEDEHTIVVPVDVFLALLERSSYNI